MPAGRCTNCGFLCNPDLLGCPAHDTPPCHKGVVYYCSQLCQESDTEKHCRVFHQGQKEGRDRGQGQGVKEDRTQGRGQNEGRNSGRGERQRPTKSLQSKRSKQKFEEEAKNRLDSVGEEVKVKEDGRPLSRMGGDFAANLETTSSVSDFKAIIQAEEEEAADKAKVREKVRIKEDARIKKESRVNEKTKSKGNSRINKEPRGKEETKKTKEKTNEDAKTKNGEPVKLKSSRVTNEGKKEAKVNANKDAEAKKEDRTTDKTNNKGDSNGKKVTKDKEEEAKINGNVKEDKTEKRNDGKIKNETRVKKAKDETKSKKEEDVKLKDEARGKEIVKPIKTEDEGKTKEIKDKKDDKTQDDTRVAHEAKVEQVERANPPISDFEPVKKSKLEAKREARRSKKEARKKEKLARIRDQAPKTEEEEVDRKSPEPKSDNDEEAIFTLPDDSDDENPKDDPNEGRILTETKKEGEEGERKMTKKEKKKEERKAFNAMKKKEKQEKIELEFRLAREAKRQNVIDLMQEDKFLEAAVHATKLMTRDKDRSLYTLRSDCYLALGKIKNALDDAEKAVELAEKEVNEEDLVKVVKLLILLGNAEKAEELVHEKLNDKCVDEVEKIKKLKALFVDCDLALKEEDWVKVLDLCENLDIICPHSFRLLLIKAEAQIHLQLYPDAKSNLSKCRFDMAKTPQYIYLDTLEKYYTMPWWQNPDVPSVLEKLEDSKRLHARATKMYDMAQKLIGHYRNAMFYLKNNNYSSASTQLNACLAVDPSHLAFKSEVHRHLSQTRESSEDKLNDLNYSIRLKESSQSYLERGNIYRSKRQYKDALTDFENAHRLDPNSPSIARTIEQTRRQIEATNRKEKKNVKNDFYALLGVPHTATMDDIKLAYKAKAKEFHPDKHAAASEEGRLEMERKMKAVNRAFRILGDPRQRDSYDRQWKRSASSDVDSDISEEDYEAYFDGDDDESDDEYANRDVFNNLFCKYFLQPNEMKESASEGAEGGNAGAECEKGKRSGGKPGGR